MALIHDYVIWPNFTTRPDVTKTGNRRMKNKELEMNLLIGPGFKLGFVLIFPFPVLVTSQSGLVCKQNSSQLHSLCVGILFSLRNSFMRNFATLQCENEAWGWNLLVWRKHAWGLLFICQLSHPLSFGSLITASAGQEKWSLAPQDLTSIQETLPPSAQWPCLWLCFPFV